MVQVLVVRVDIGVVTYESITPQCGRSVVQLLVVRVDIGVMTYESLTPPMWEVSVSSPGCQGGNRRVIYTAVTSQCPRSVVQVLVIRVDIGIVTYEAMTPHCIRSVIQVLAVRVDIGVVIYEAMTACVGGQ